MDRLVDEAGWIVGQGVVNADPLDAEAVKAHIAPAPLCAVAPDAVTLTH